MDANYISAISSVFSAVAAIGAVLTSITLFRVQNKYNKEKYLRDNTNDIIEKWNRISKARNHIKIIQYNIELGDNNRYSYIHFLQDKDEELYNEINIVKDFLVEIKSKDEQLEMCRLKSYLGDEIYLIFNSYIVKYYLENSIHKDQFDKLLKYAKTLRFTNVKNKKCDPIKDYMGTNKA